MSELARTKSWNWQQEYLEQKRRAEKAEKLNKTLIHFLKAAIARCWMNKEWRPQDIQASAVELGLLVLKDTHVYGYSSSVKAAGGEQNDSINIPSQRSRI